MDKSEWRVYNSPSYNFENILQIWDFFKVKKKFFKCGCKWFLLQIKSSIDPYYKKELNMKGHIFKSLGWRTSVLCWDDCYQILPRKMGRDTPDVRLSGDTIGSEWGKFYVSWNESVKATTKTVPKVQVKSIFWLNTVDCLLFLFPVCVKFILRDLRR